MKTIQHTITVELRPGDNEKAVRDMLDQYAFTAEGVAFLDTEYNKSFSLVKATLQKLIKRRR